MARARSTPTLEELMGFEWCKLDKLDQKIGEAEDEIKKANKYVVRDDLKAFLDDWEKLKSENLNANN